MDRLQQRRKHEELTAGGRRRRRGSGDDGGAMAASRRGRFSHDDEHRGGGGGGGCGTAAAATVPVVDQADCTAQSCRSCVAVTLADAIALGCCPCAVVSLLGLAFVKAPLAVARRCLRRLRRRRGELRHKKRVRDMDPAAAKAKCRAGGHVEVNTDVAAKGAARGLEMMDARGGGEAAAVRAVRTSNSSASGRLDAEKVWMEMYRVGQWGFGRLSISTTPSPPMRPGCVATGRCGDFGGGGGGRKDVDLRCES